MIWRVGLIDSCASHPHAVSAAGFAGTPSGCAEVDIAPDHTGHGLRMADILCAGAARVELILGQVFFGSGLTSAAAVAMAIDWAVAQRAQLLHMSLGLSADRAALATAVERALAAGVIIVAACPARGAPVYPSSYAGVIRATGDARCTADELSHLRPWTFGAAPTPWGPVGAAAIPRGGASLGAARVTRAITQLPVGTSTAEIVETLSARARFHGPERRPSARFTDRPGAAL